MKKPFSPLSARLRLVLSAVAGTVAGLALPELQSMVTRGSLRRNVAVWLFLPLIGGILWRSDRTRLRRIAVEQSEGAATVLGTHWRTGT